MEENYISVSIPDELKQYQKIVEEISPKECKTEQPADFGVELIKDNSGAVSEADYYSDTGDLLKKIYYKGSSVSRIEHYRYGRLRSEETYKEGKLLRKSIYDRNGNISSSINYEYNRKDFITAIKKNYQDKRYEVLYDYDELGRPDSRVLKINTKVLETQKFRYDIIDRIVEYKDNSQTIKVDKININNELLKYTIIDNAGNHIEISNKFLYSEYIGTEIDLNGHKTTVIDNSYLNNVMLKKPYASEEDLDLAMSSVLNKSQIQAVKRTGHTDITDTVISTNAENKILPISIRKLRLIQKVG